MSSNLENSPADVTRWLLVAAGQGSDPTASPLGNWPIYASSEPSDPDNCITIYDTVGNSDGRTMPDGEIQEHRGIQVRVRASAYEEGWEKASEVRAWMSEVANQNVLILPEGNEYLVWGFSNLKPINAIGRDTPTTKRSLFTINCLVSLQQLLVTGT